MRTKLILIIIFFLISSCYKNFKYDMNNEAKINISCFLRANDTIRVYVSYLIDINDMINSDNKYIDNAEIYIYKEGVLKDKLEYTNNNNSSGWYVSKNFIPTENANYQLKVIVPGFDTIFAQTYVPTAVKIDKITYTETREAAEFGGEAIKLNVNLLFTDPNNIRNYYLIDNYSDLNDPIVLPKDQNGFAISNNLFSSYFSDSLINGQIYSINFSDKQIYYEGYSSDTIIFLYELKSVSKDLYYFNKTLALKFLQKNNPLSEPVVIYSNVKNGTGIFAGMSSDIDSIVLIKNQIK